MLGDGCGPMISIRGVNKNFGALHVLRDIDLDIDRGQVVVVIGPSGSGKSTLCRVINRLETVDSGTISIDGEQLPVEGRKLAQLRSDVGMVFQSFNLFAHKTVLENVMLAPMKVRNLAREEARERATALLERVGVANQAQKYPAQLSGGQQQRVAIARSLAMDPKVMLPRQDPQPLRAKGTLMPNFSWRLIGAAVLTITLPLTATACSGGGSGGGSGDGNKIVVGTKFDQPGLGLKKPDGTMTGFDVDVARYVAKELGYSEDQIEWKESPSAQRETLIENGQVKYIVATYSITDKRKEKVDFAGPYLLTGQSLLVAAANTDITGPESLQDNKKLCSVTGSTPAQRIKDKYPGVQLQQYDTYSACVEALKNGAIDAVTTDEVILAGYAAQSPGAFKIVGKPFSEERLGIGVKKDDGELRAKINDALEKMEKDGAWKAAFEKNLGPAGITAPEPPRIDRY